MSNCPWYINPEVFNSTEVRIYENEVVSNYFQPGILNIVTGSVRTPQTGRCCIMNVIASVNQKNQIITLPSDPLYFKNIPDLETAEVSSIEYALRCLEGFDLIHPFQANIITYSQSVYRRLFYIFETARIHQGNYPRLNRFYNSLDNSTDQMIFNIIRALKLNLYILYCRKASENALETYQIFRDINQTIEATMFDISVIEALISFIDQMLKISNKNSIENLKSYIPQIKNQGIIENS